MLARDAEVLSIVRVGAVQPNISRTFQNDDRLYDENIARQVALTDQLVRAHALDLIVWPESAFSDDVTLDPQWRVRMEAAARAWHTPILLGAVMRAGTRGTNSAVLLSREGLWQDRYDKRRLVPFGEYIPKGPLMASAVAAMGAGTHDLVSGHTPGVMFLSVKQGQVPFGITICSEEAYPSLFRDLSKQGAAFFVVMLNDAWFSRPEALRIHGSFAALRAVETGRAVVRIGNTGWTAAFDGRGRAIGEGPLLQSAGWRAFDLPLSQVRTAYVRFGFFFPWVCGVFVIMILILYFRNRYRAHYDV
jgi:apolipoprotein N-acyltransferase